MILVSQRSSTAPSYFQLLKVRLAVGQLLDDARERSHELLRTGRWKGVYDINDELRQDNPPDWLKKAHRIVQTMLDFVRPVLMAQPQHPGYLREILRAFVRLTRLVNDVRRDQLK